ncbi:MAG: MoaD/ThiS family protein [Sulfolobales archaeon]|nr:MoaD/ThiS family protein [Sulfolobales archaeon]MCX8199400.1 MoaD/ThiS family protein [Sulfolobales archaeon]MDW8170286.1 MoaD/ThiS family protein [Desulfurococcaceae archaeon]
MAEETSGIKVKVREFGSGVKEVSLKNRVSVGELVKSLGYIIEEYVVAVSGTIVTEDYLINDGDEVVLYPVVSGG